MPIHRSAPVGTCIVPPILGPDDLTIPVAAMFMGPIHEFADAATWGVMEKVSI